MPDRVQELLAKHCLNPPDFEEKISRSSGPGGQHVNKVSTALRLRHLPTGLTVLERSSRSLYSNRLLAYKELIHRIEALHKQNTQKQKALTAKKRRQKARRSLKTKERMLEKKRIRGEIKRTRNKIIF